MELTHVTGVHRQSHVGTALEYGVPNHRTYLRLGILSVDAQRMVLMRINHEEILTTPSNIWPKLWVTIVCIVSCIQPILTLRLSIECPSSNDSIAHPPSKSWALYQEIDTITTNDVIILQDNWQNIHSYIKKIKGSPTTWMAGNGCFESHARSVRDPSV